MQLRIASIAITHRLKYLKENCSLNDLFATDKLDEIKTVIDYYHTVLSYFNSLKEVGKTQSQLSHYLPGDVNYVIKNTIPWSFLDKLTRNESEINYSELTGRLTGEEIKTNLNLIESKWSLVVDRDNMLILNQIFPPEFVISTNMISVGIDVSRFNTMIINSMPRNIAEYIQASSRVARDKEGIVFTVHHPFRSRDISHYQKFKEFHEKFYSYVEPISVTPFATKALDRYLAMFAAVLIRHNKDLGLMNNNEVVNNIEDKRDRIVKLVLDEIKEVNQNSKKLDLYLNERKKGLQSSVDGIISDNDLDEVELKLNRLMNKWLERLRQTNATNPPRDLKFRDSQDILNSLYSSIIDLNHPNHWKVSHSLREIAPSTVIKTVQQ